MTDLDTLLERTHQLLDRFERLLPQTHSSVSWDAIAFRWRTGHPGLAGMGRGHLQPITHPQHLRPQDLLNIDRQKSLLERNTRQFLQCLPANNALLWGSRGTGKSSLIKALLTRYADQGLRVIEVDKAHLIDLPDIVALLHERAERFIVYSDDLSFEADDPSYKALKATLDGSLAAAPANVLIYATSNRRHLMPEQMRDNLEARHVEGELHHGEAVEEKISLSERFGLWLSFYPFKQDEYLDIVFHWLRQLGADTAEEQTIKKEALQFALHRGSRSGRVAYQFACDLAGRQQLTP